MNLGKYQVNNEPEINLTPLIDVVFLLLIFFMVTTTFIKESSLNIDLPRSTSAETSQIDSEIIITIDKSGHYYIAKKRLQSRGVLALQLAIKRSYADVLNKADGHRFVTINADTRSPFQSVITALDAVRNLGLTEVSLGTLKTTAP